jgi:hypothetical protein
MKSPFAAIAMIDPIGRCLLPCPLKSSQSGYIGIRDLDAGKDQEFYGTCLTIFALILYPKSRHPPERVFILIISKP